MTKILIVEDETSFHEALAFLLGKEGFETIVAENGRAALEMFAKHGADLVLLDLMIPELSGIEVCRSIRATSQVPIIMLTAKDAEITLLVTCVDFLLSNHETNYEFNIDDAFRHGVH